MNQWQCCKALWSGHALLVAKALNGCPALPCLAAAAAAGEILKPNTPHTPLPASAGQDSIARLDKLRHAKGSLRTAEIRRNMQRTMQSDAAVFRTQVRVRVPAGGLGRHFACRGGGEGMEACARAGSGLMPAFAQRPPVRDVAYTCLRARVRVREVLCGCLALMQATLEAGCKSIDDVVDSFKDVKVRGALSHWPSIEQHGAPTMGGGFLPSYGASSHAQHHQRAARTTACRRGIAWLLARTNAPQSLTLCSPLASLACRVPGAACR